MAKHDEAPRTHPKGSAGRDVMKVWRSLSPSILRNMEPITTWVIPLVTLVLGAFLGFWVSVAMTRPAPRIVGGSGSSDAHNKWKRELAVIHPPRLVGFETGRTVIFGMKLMSSHVWGSYHDRAPARSCMALLLDSEKNALTYLTWLPRTPGGEVGTVRDIGPSEEGRLALFAGDGDPDSYFVWEPTFATLEPKVHERTRRFRAGGTYYIDLLWNQGNRKKRFKITVTQDFQGAWNVRVDQNMWRKEVY